MVVLKKLKSVEEKGKKKGFFNIFKERGYYKRILYF